MTKYEIAERIRTLLDCDFDDFIDAALELADKVENDEENYIYVGERENGEWVEGCVLILDNDEYRIATSCIQGDDENLFTVCAYKVDPDTIE